MVEKARWQFSAWRTRNQKHEILCQYTIGTPLEKTITVAEDLFPLTDPPNHYLMVATDYIRKRLKLFNPGSKQRGCSIGRPTCMRMWRADGTVRGPKQNFRISCALECMWAAGHQECAGNFTTSAVQWHGGEIQHDLGELFGDCFRWTPTQLESTPSIVNRKYFRKSLVWKRISSTRDFWSSWG